MQNLSLIIKIIHVSAGATALISGLLAILFRKQVKIHKPIGRIYFWSMTVIFTSAVYMAFVKFNVFLFCVAFFTYYACLTAYRALRLKRLHLDQEPDRLDWIIEAFFGSMHLAFVGFAVLKLYNGQLSLGTVSLVFGLLGLQGNYSTIQRLKKRLAFKNYWLLAHISGMLGSYIGAITAFTVNNYERIPLPPIVLWLGPTVLIVPFIVYETKQQAKKAGKLVHTQKVST
ncbi:MAG: hypothetical protein MUF75_01950 [Bacteroidia bacterium]|jgi:uncharacterized membrane protein|nr:hypothetical protein [Bacteroidia bacterium]